MLWHACRFIALSAVLLGAVQSLQAGIPADIRRQFEFAMQDAHADQSGQDFCQNAGKQDFSRSTNARCAAIYNRVLANLRSRDEVIENMIAEHRGEMNSADLADVDRTHRKLHELIDWVRQLAVAFQGRRDSASY